MALSVLGRLGPGAKTHLQRLRTHRFGRSVGVMLAGTFCGQAISLLLSPVLTRLFTPTQFGVLGVYSSALLITAMLATFGYELAIPICLAEREYRNLAALCWLSLALVCTLMACGSFLLSAHVFELAGLMPLQSFRYLFPLGLLWLGGYHLLLASATRAGNFGDIARTRLSQGISGPSSQVLFGALQMGAPGLVTGFVIGQAGATLPLLRRMVPGLKTALQEVSGREIAAVARRYVRFPLYASWSRLLDVAGSGDILFLLFAACYAPDIAGLMFLCERVVVRPLMIVSTSVLQVFTGEAGRTVSEDPAKLRRRFRQVVPAQFVITSVWILAANIAAGWIFPPLFGAAWGHAIPYLRALSLSYLVQVTLHPVSNTLLLLERQASAAAWQICRLGLVVAAVLLAWRAGLSARDALWISSGVQALCCFVLLGLMLSAMQHLDGQRSHHFQSDSRRLPP